jgi:hypothetical protein
VLLAAWDATPTKAILQPETDNRGATSRVSIFLPGRFDKLNDREGGSTTGVAAEVLPAAEPAEAAVPMACAFS